MTPYDEGCLVCGEVSCQDPEHLIREEDDDGDDDEGAAREFGSVTTPCW